VTDAVAALASTLVEAWAAPAPALPADPPERAADLARGLEVLAAGPGHDATPAVLDLARACAARRSAGHDPEQCAVVHGDAHPANLLRAPGAPTGWLLVDAEGPVAERAYDVGIALRDLSSHLQDPATAAVRLSEWCAQAAAATGTDPVAVWDWAYLERVSTGLYVTSIGSRAVGRPLLHAAAAVLEGITPSGS
jgi:streptomycin 6-kinase